MAIEEKEEQSTNLKDLIELVERDPIPTNIFTIEDTDTMVILGKLNAVIAHLKDIQATISSSDTKATQALESATQALESARDSISASNNALQASSEALASSNTALETANRAITTANACLASASEAKENASIALDKANSAEQKADTALTNSENALNRAIEADTKADSAITQAGGASSQANIAVSTANEANTNAETAYNTATEANSKADNAINTANEANNKASSAESKANDALSRIIEGLGTKIFNTLGQIMSEAKFTGHNGINVDMSEDDSNSFDIRLDDTITTAIEDTHKKAQANAEDIVNITDMLAGVEESVETTLPNRITATETKNTEQDTTIANLATQLMEYITELRNKNTEQDTTIDSKINKVSGSSNYIPKFTSSGITSSGILASRVVFSNDTILGSSSSVVEITLYKDGSNVNKIYLQWGKMTTSSSGSSYFTFPKSFTSASSYTAVATPHEQGAYAHVNVSNISGSQVRFGLRYQGGLYAEPITWLAIGW